MIPRRFWWLFDLLAMAWAFWLAYELVPLFHPLFEEGGPLRFDWLDEIGAPKAFAERWPAPQDLILFYLSVAPLSLFALEALGAYRPILYQKPGGIVLTALVAPLPGLCLMVLVLFGMHSGYGNRLFVFSFVWLSGLLLAAYRLLLRAHYSSLARKGEKLQTSLLVASGGCLGRVASFLRDSRKGFRLCGYLEVESESPVAASARECICLSAGVGDKEGGGMVVERPPEPQAAQGVNCLGTVDKLGDILISQHIDEVVAVTSDDPAVSSGWVQAVVSCCDQLGVTLRIVPYELAFRRERALHLVRADADFPLPGLVFMPAYAHTEALFAKRVFDFIVASVLLALISPLLALIALLIKLSEPKEPTIYRWRVVGRNGQPFTSYKFRTMVANADALKAQLMDRNEMKGPVFKIAEDPRVTRLGRTLRKFSLDELPQLWSVVKGDMSLVGPRPAYPHELKRYEFWHKRKLSIKPGMTCLWQVNGRNAVDDFDDWVKMDLEYIDNWSFWLDLRILLRTAWVVVAGTGK
jgi:lipopolysaccharide/colanic/teichoic acid biosynthesis glycosyltransferase